MKNIEELAKDALDSSPEWALSGYARINGDSSYIDMDDRCLGFLAVFAALVAAECARQAERSHSAEHAEWSIRAAFPMPKECQQLVD